MSADLIISDGGMGRELQRLGAPFRQPEWSALALIEAPEFVEKAHRLFLAAGAQLVTTNSYAVVPFHIGDDCFERRGHEIAALAGQCARNSADAYGAKVAGSLPPPMGSYRADLFEERAARGILSVLIDALRPFADLWLAETLSCLDEARLVGSLLVGDERPLWLSFTIKDEGPAMLRSGESIADAAQLARQLGATALLFNCSAPEVMDEAVQRAKAALGHDDMRIGVYANGFAHQDENVAANEALRDLRADLDPAAYLAFARKWIGAGATIIGGCCGIGPEHIKALSEGLR